MRDANEIVRERQRLIRREMDRRGILLKQVQLDGGWETVSTVASYFPQPESNAQPASMSVPALYKLIETGALPTELLSMLLPAGFVIVQVPEEIDYDAVSEGCRAFIDAKDRAHHPDSEAGRDLSPAEQADLSARVVQLRAA